MTTVGCWTISSTASAINMEQSVFRRYGQAFVETADDYQRKIEEIETLHSAFKATPEFVSLLGSPKLADSHKKQMLATLLKTFADSQLEAFIGVIVDNSRARNIPEILEQTLEVLYEKVGVKRGYLFSPIALDRETVSRIEETLAHKLGVEVRLKFRLDPSLIGGVKVALDGKVYDASVIKKIKDMKLHLLGGRQNEN